MHTLRHARTFIRMHTNAPMHDAHSNKKKEEAYDEINMAQIFLFLPFCFLSSSVSGQFVAMTATTW